MDETLEVSKLLELQKSLPERAHAAAQAVRHAEQRLALVLIRRAAGQAIKGFEVAVARMALSKALRDAEDLQRIQSTLPAMLELARGAPQGRSDASVLQIRTGAREAQSA